jgi:hypothetical protein
VVSRSSWSPGYGPAVRARLAARFGESPLVGGEELTSVAWGLAARAREVFGAS